MEVKITCTTELVQGGCNACTAAPSTSYKITFDEVGMPLGNLDVESLVMAIALKNGFRQELVMDFDEEAIVFKKEGKEVTMVDFYGQLTYTSQGQKINVRNQTKDNELTFTEANKVLMEMFDLESVIFNTEEIEA